MRAGRCKFTQAIYLKAERGLRDAALEAARAQGQTLSAVVRDRLRELVAQHAVASQPEARP